MRKFFGWACLSAALIGSSGFSYADEANVAGDTVGDATYQSSLDEALKDSRPYQLCSCDSCCGTDACCGSDSCCGSDPCCGDACHCGDPCVGSFLDNTVIFAGADTYKSIGDRVTNIAGGPGALSSSFGGVTGFNSGFALGDSELRGQVGASYGVYDLRGRLAIVPQSTDVEEQGFITAGVYKRGNAKNDERLSFGGVIDSFTSNNWGINANSVELGQVRGIMGYSLSERTEIGGWGTAHLWHDQAAITVAGAPAVRREVRAANQVNTYIRRNTAFGASLMGYVGVFDRADVQAWQFGMTGKAPLSQNFSLYGNFNYAVPSARAGAGGSGEEQYNVQFGLAYYFGGKAVSRSVTGQKGLPLLDVANNGSFLITD